MVTLFTVRGVGRAFAFKEANSFKELHDLINDIGEGGTMEIKIDKELVFDKKVTIENADLTILGSSYNGSKVNIKGIESGSKNSFFEFTGNKRSTVKLENLSFTNGCYYEKKDRSGRGGGAAYFGENVIATMKNISFIGNKSKYRGGALFFPGKSKRDKNSPVIFEEKITFENNKVSKNACGFEDGGGAINAENSSFIFRGVTVFKGNESTSNGGAINFYEAVEKKTPGGEDPGSSLTFEKEVTFEKNKVTGKVTGNTTFNKKVVKNDVTSNGGAIRISRSSLTFKEKAIFRENSCYHNGGAIEIRGDKEKRANVIFHKQAIFEENKIEKESDLLTDNGGAIFAYENVSIEFKNGLRMVNNFTKNEMSGAIYMEGFGEERGGGRPVIITIVQDDLDNPTEFKGNRSGGEGRNFVYMDGKSRLNFTVRKGDVNVYDVIAGTSYKKSSGGGILNTSIINKIIEGVCSDRSDNIVTIDDGDGWFNLKKGGLIRNVDLVNEGNFSLEGADTDKVVTRNFTNSGRIRVEILENGACNTIKADNMTFEAGTILEIIATAGTYKENSNYDILVSTDETNVINGASNINVNLLQNDLKAIGRLSEDGKVYSVFITEKSCITSESYLEAKDTKKISLKNREFEALFDGDGALSVLENVYIDHPQDEKLKHLTEIIKERSNSVEDRKEAFDQISSPKLLANIINSSLLGSTGQRYEMKTANGLSIGHRCRNAVSANEIKDGAVAILLNYGHNFERLVFNRDLSLGLDGDLSGHFLRDIHSNRAKTIGGTIALQLGIEMVRNFNLILNLSYGRNNYKVDRNIEKLKEIMESNFSTNLFKAAVAVENRFVAKDYIILATSVALEASMLTHVEFSEKSVKIPNLLIDSNSYRLTAGSLNLAVTLDLAKLRPFFSIGAKYLFSASSPEISVSLEDYPGYTKFKSRGTEVGRLSGCLAAGISYKFSNHISLSVVADYHQDIKNYKLSTFGIAFGIRLLK
ncbi:MAG: autotransporter outer membrane beta-barrel domain-containing protein [Rickettsiales bacterium]|nr:autotransporter outer membrane beta-barrel domain-containing protein [Rickettsiales bacterium]